MNTKFLNGVWRVLFVLVFAFSLAGISAREARATTYIVSILADTGAGSLRSAITSANTNPGADTITFSVSGTITLGSSLPNITDDLTINGTGQNVTISGSDLYRVFYLASGYTLTIIRLTISHGKALAQSGGAFFNYGGTLILSYTTLAENYATNYGGAIYVTGGSLNVSNSTFRANSAGTSGGGIKTFDSTVAVSKCTFINNSAANNGAGIFNDNGATMTVTNSTFSGNISNWGGGIGSASSILSVANSTFSGNSAVGGGGGIAVNGGTLNLKNSILANSVSGADCLTNVGIGMDIHNLIESNCGCGTPVSGADPNLGPLASNGGPTKTFELLGGSPAMNAGDDAVCTAAPVGNKDQRGVTRPFGAHCDIGSYEQNKGSLTTRSVGTYDGYILESGENTNVGGTLDGTAATFILGDGAQDKQYRAILHFNTASLPDTAVITKVTLKIRRQGVVGTDPFTILGGLKVDVRKPYFGTIFGLETGDFQAAAGKNTVSQFQATPVSFWYSALLNATGRAYVNKTGVTQFRLRFYTGDNDNNSPDLMTFYSGNYVTASLRPTLVITYEIP